MCGIGGYCGGWGGAGVAEEVGFLCLLEFLGDLFFVMLRFVFVLFKGTHSRNRRAFCIDGERKTSERSVDGVASRFY